MLAHHPTTGQPIRILRTETQISFDLKTLVWVRETFQTSARWGRWFPVVSEVGALSICGAETITAIVLGPDANVEEWFDTLKAVGKVNTECLLLAPSKVMDKLYAKGFLHDRTLLWEDLFDSYPYIGEPVSTTDTLEKVLFSLAHILRMNRIVWSSNVDREAMPFGLRAQHDAWAKACNGVLKQVSVNSDDSCIPRTWLIQQYFRHSSNRRAREISTCLEKNLECPYVDKLMFLNETTFTDLPASDKIVSHIIGHRLTYRDVLLAARKHIPAGDYIVFANADIYINDTLRYIWRIQLAEKRMFLALLRWEMPANEGAEPHIFGPRADSQDTWILARDSLDFEPIEEDFGFPFGKSGCDNALALIMMRRKFLVSNPAYTIRTIHMHSSNIRNYDPKDVLYRPHYLYLDPTAIQSCNVIRDLSVVGAIPKHVKQTWLSQALGASFMRPIHGVNDNGVATVCRMLQNNDEWSLNPNDSNMYTPTAVDKPLYNFKGGVFVNADGLVSSFNEIYVGNHVLWMKAWESTKQSSLTNCMHVPHMISVPFDTSKGISLSAWSLHYLPRVLAIRRLLKDAGLVVPEFLVPQIADIGSFLNDLEWSDLSGSGTGSITVIPMLTDMNYFSEDVWVVPPTDNHQYVTSEDITLLRTLLPKANHVASKFPVVVFCVEDDQESVCTREWAESVAEHIIPKTWTVRYVAVNDLPSERRKAFSNSAWVIGSGSALDWMWYMHAGATVMEFMSDSKPVGDHIHLAGAAGIRHIVGVVKKEPLIHQRQNALMDVGRAIKQYGFKDVIESIRRSPYDTPTIVLPDGKGLHGIMHHVGDTFREMAEIWAERKYVTLERSEHTHYCWWGGIGEVLLYDRPTPRWWNSSVSYQMALFGNCALPGPGNHVLRQSVWSFWPRSPRAIEAAVARFDVLRGYAKRPIASLFLGKIENGIQREHRTRVDWSKCVELFSMPIDPAGGDYPFTQEEYINKLCSSRFGLCLPGFGPKCNREIEYFACGVVPIVTPGVDMKGYLVAPQEGIHYFVASTPAEVQAIVKNTSADRWMLMSAAGRVWWRTYASAEGLFRLTWARIEQCRPYFNVGIPRNFLN